MALPDLAPFKAYTNDQPIDAATWTDYLHAWVVCARLYLAASDEAFTAKLKKSDSLPAFLTTFVKEQNRIASGDRADQLEDELRQTSFLLLHRIWHSPSVPDQLRSFSFLSDVSLFYGAIPATSQMLEKVWSNCKLSEDQEFQDAKQHLLESLEQKHVPSSDLSERLYQHVALARLCTGYGQFLMVGSDFLDAVCSAHRQSNAEVQSKLATLAYFSLFSLFRGSEQKHSLLLDHLYSLRSDHQAGKTGSSLLHRLVTGTPLLYKLRHLATTIEMGRLTSMLQSLEAIGPPPPIKRKRGQRNKGKAIALNGMSIHNEAQISQIQELFPDLGSAFIAALLAEYADDVEQVTAALLEESLPAHLVDADRTAMLPPPASTQDDPLAAALHALPPTSLPATRRNVFDDDAFDNLAVSTSQLHIGRRDDVGDAKAVLGEAPNKAAILAALAAIDPDDDERDDTYDIEDVGGTVDAAQSGDPAAANERTSEELLFRAWKASPGVFGRDGATRRSQARASLREQSGMTDEALEGWALMLDREPDRAARMEAKYGAFTGNQRELGSTKWRSAEEESGEDGDGSGGRGGRRAGRGRGRGRGGIAGNVAGEANDKGTQIARQRKDANKGSRANHSRRDGRAKKLARAGYAG